MPHCAGWDPFESLETEHRNGNESKMHAKTNMNNSNDATLTLETCKCVRVFMCMIVCSLHSHMKKIANTWDKS